MKKITFSSVCNSFCDFQKILVFNFYLGPDSILIEVTYIFGNELNTVVCCWLLRHCQVHVTARFSIRATRQVLRCQTRRCFFFFFSQILLAAEGHTRLKPHMTKLLRRHVQ